MNLRDQLEALEKFQSVATLAGIRGQIDDQRMLLVSVFDFGNGRTQTVYVKPVEHPLEKVAVVHLFSPCLQVKKGLFKGITRDQAVDLLVKNEAMTFARYGVWQSDEGHMIVASVDHILDTLDPEEVKTSMHLVALAADAYEKLHGQDQY